MNSLMEKIKFEIASASWANKQSTRFEYSIEKNQYRIIEYTPDLKNFRIGLSQRNETNCPVVIKGFVAYLIRNWNENEKQIFENYYKYCLNKYKSEEQKKPGSSMRDLDSEFYPAHLLQENNLITFSKQLKSYISQSEIMLINQYIKAYFNYIKMVYSPKISNKDVPVNNPTKELSVSDWCIIFYYLDESSPKEGYKIKRIEKFIQDYNVQNKNGVLTTKGSFKKEYHEIENRINGKNNSKPLPPERIEKILPYLKKDKKTYNIAKSDIEHLGNMINEERENEIKL